MQVKQMTIVWNDVLTNRVQVEIRRIAFGNWGAWFLANAIPDFSQGGHAVAPKPSDIRFKDNPRLMARGVQEVVIQWAKKSSNPELGPVLVELGQRFQNQIDNLLRERNEYWKQEGPSKRIRKSSQGDRTLARKRPRNQDLVALEAQVRAMKASGLSQHQMCQRLDANAIPTPRHSRRTAISRVRPNT